MITSYKLSRAVILGFSIKLHTNWTIAFDKIQLKDGEKNYKKKKNPIHKISLFYRTRKIKKLMLTAKTVQHNAFVPVK